ncbi:molybdopterin-guanine dinucleotide biosynthesis protein B [Cohnella hongkongensis]|uniref:Molybdopterin-guanine dinucleotide biosynthesis protein B n=1 Tax=Cohnella hongkongensis TaxID=178337 RepID=A0ABV9F502_9BACL
MRIIQIVGYKNSGKTTLACELVRRLAAEGRKVGTLKRDAHQFEPEPPGTDTWKHRQAGAAVTAIASSSRTAWVLERGTPVEELVSRMGAHGLDDLIVEGFKTAAYPKVALIRDDKDADLLRLANVIAVGSRTKLPRIEREAAGLGLPVFVLPNAEAFDPLIAFLRQR